MAPSYFDFTTGPSTLPSVGTLSYNGCVFSPLFATNVSGEAIKDEARRTVMYMRYVITVDGYVTLPTNETSINPNTANMRRLLTAQAGELIYRGRGCDINVNIGGDVRNDVVWGPVPELLEFQPLGGEASAKVQWRVTVCVTEIKPPATGGGGGGNILQPINRPPDFDGTKQGGGIGAGVGGLAKLGGMLQFNYETTVSYGEDGFCALAVRGVLEIPLTRTPSQRIRTLSQTADEFRTQIDARVMTGIDLSRFRMVRRNFHLSRDKRILTWDFGAEERPYMDIPPDCTIARGTYSVRPARSGMGLVSWLCTLRATYTVRNDRPRRTAWEAFLLLLRHRMAMSTNQPKDIKANPNAANRGDLPQPAPSAVPAFVALGNPALTWLAALLETQNGAVKDKPNDRKALICDFNIDEGLYLDSKTISFSATWRLVSPFSHILLTSGIWTKIPEEDARNQNVWALSMRDVQGSSSCVKSPIDPKLDVIVDFGS